MKRLLKSYANFLFEAGILEKTNRSGFRHLGGWDQSISEHILRTAYAGYLLAYMERDKGLEVSIEKVIEICLFHDFGEARALDLDYISQKYSKTDELKAIEDAVKNLPFGQRIISAFIEIEESSTLEGVIAKDADNIELLCSLKEIMDNGNKQAADWIAPLLKRLKTSSAQTLAKEIIKTDSNDWWYENKSDDYWVRGGKRKDFNVIVKKRAKDYGAKDRN
jgi:putative hydrolases of HD superfamily